jgi:branched-chain amino acid transport system substrate-binding protein
VKAFSLALLFLAGCASFNRPQPVVIGAIYNLTGDQSGLDVQAAEGARLAVDEANRAGGVLGRPVKLLLVDGGSDAETVRTRTHELLDESASMSAVIGLSDTDMVLAAAPVAAAHGRAFVTSGATSPRLPQQLPEVILACFGDNAQASAAADFAFHDRHARTASILFDAGDSYTRLLQEYFAIHFRQLGGKVVSMASYSDAGLGAAVTRLAKADVIFFAAPPQDVARGTRLLRKNGFTSDILGGDSYDSDAAWRDAAGLSDIFFTTHAWLGPENASVATFRAAFLAAHPNYPPDAFAALGYDSVRLLLAAIARAKSADPTDVHEALSNIGTFEGITGRMTFPPGERMPHKSVTIVEVRNGKRQFVRQFTPSEVPAP